MTGKGEPEDGGGASRTTSVASGTSSATDVSLREHLTSLIDAAEQRADRRFESMKEMVATAFETSQEAIHKADVATEKRFESVNEFRAQLTDQTATFVTKDMLSALADKLEVQIDRGRQDLDKLAKRLDLREGQSIGSRLTVGTVVTVITISVAVIGLVVVLANILTPR